MTPHKDLPSTETDFKLFLELNKNKEGLQHLMGKELIRNAPQNKTIVVSGAFEDPVDTRSNKLSPAELANLSCDHEEADTRVVLHAVKSDKSRVVMYCNDTDILISALTNYEKLENK